jgi:hypothetical protein
MALTEKIAMETAALARADSLARVALYAPQNRGAAIYARLSKVVRMPAWFRGSRITAYLRMLYTAERYFIDVHGDK